MLCIFFVDSVCAGVGQPAYFQFLWVEIALLTVFLHRPAVHAVRLADTGADPHGLALLRVSFLHFQPLFRVFKPKIHLPRQVSRVARFEKAPLIQGKLPGGGKLRIGNHRNQAAGKGLHTGNAFYFGVG